jgi:O-antigen ligase
VNPSRTQQWILTLAGFLIPFAFFPSLLLGRPPIITADEIQLFIEGSILLPKLLVLGIFALIIWRVQSSFSWRESFVWFMSAHWLLASVSTFIANDDLPFKMLGGQYRLDGWVYQTALTSLALGIFGIGRTNPNASLALSIGLVASSVTQSILMLFQRINFDPIAPLTRLDTNSAPTGTLTHPGMAAGLLMCALLLGIGFYQKTEKRTRPWLLLSLIIISVGLSITNNRASLYGIAIGLALIWFWGRKYQILLLSVSSFIVILGARAVIPNPQGFERSLEDSRSFEVRIHIWETSLSAFRQMRLQPIIGGGPDGFRLEILRNPPLNSYLAAYGAEVNWPKNVQIASVKRLEREPLRRSSLEVTFSQFGTEKSGYMLEIPLVLDRAHNLWFDRALSYGFFDAFLWLILYLMPIIWSFRSWRTLNSQTVILGFTTLALFIYYLVWFPVIQVEPLHVAVLALAWARQSRGASGSVTGANDSKRCTRQNVNV